MKNKKDFTEKLEMQLNRFADKFVDGIISLFHIAFLAIALGFAIWCIFTIINPFFK